MRIIGLENCSILVFGTYPYLLSSRFVSCGWVNILLFLFSPFLIVCSLSQEGGFTHLLSSTAQRTRSVSNPQNGVREKERERERVRVRLLGKDQWQSILMGPLARGYTSIPIGYCVAFGMVVRLEGHTEARARALTHTQRNEKGTLCCEPKRPLCHAKTLTISM